MIISNKKEKSFLLVGDLFVFALSLWISLAIRSGDIIPLSIFNDHLIPFIFIFIAWLLVFIIAGLYDKYTTILKDSLSGIIFNAQLVNSVIAIAFFYLIPYFGIAPKTVLFLNLIISFVLIYVWRINSNIILGLKRKEPAILIGSGEEMRSVLSEINENPRSELKFVSVFDLDKQDDISNVQSLIQKIQKEGVLVVVIDLKDKRVEPILPMLYSQLFLGVKFIDLDKVYESVFDRVPLSFLQYDWFLEHISLKHDLIYSFTKRFLDIIVSLVILIVLVLLFPFIAVSIVLNTRKFKIIISQKRIGEGGKIIKIHKFLTMLMDDGGDDELRKINRLTEVGKLLRKTRIDELPQAWNVLVGELSLIGPRPELPLFVEQYEKEIPFYKIRHIIKPGLSGWAQIYQNNPPKGGINFNDTKTKLSYDLYYLKNKSLILDLNIALKTIKTLLSRKGK